jgi:3-oxoacyl-[acyl-carrier-protein] synthase II
MTGLVITGIGMVCSLGLDCSSVWANLLAGQAQMGKISSFDPSEYDLQDCVVAGVDTAGLRQRILLLKDSGFKTPKRGRFRQLVVAAAAEALRDAAILPQENEEDFGAGFVMGTMAGGAFETESIVIRAHEGKKPLVSDNMGKRPGVAAQDVGAAFGLRGPMFAVDAACASGATAIVQAGRLIATGSANWCLAGGAEASLIPSSLKMVKAVGIIATSFSEQPNQASRPFDLRREGYVPAEGACLLVIENEKAATERGASPYARIVGWSELTYSGHPTHMPVDFIVKGMQRALEAAQVHPDCIGWINAHATSTKVGDSTEAQAIQQVFGDRAITSAPKSLTGHLLGASGAFEAAVSALSLRHQLIPPTVNLDEPDLSCPVNCYPKTLNSEFAYVLSNSWGFGGSGCCLVLQRC